MWHTALNCKAYRDESKKNFDFYHEKELSHTLTFEEKVGGWQASLTKVGKIHGRVVENCPRCCSQGGPHKKKLWANGGLCQTGIEVQGQVYWGWTWLWFCISFLKLFDLLYAKKVPVLVFSAGIGNIIEIMLKELNCYHPNMHVVSNFLQYDSDGEDAKGIGERLVVPGFVLTFLSAWNEELIHVFNKHMVRLDDCPYKAEVVNRKNGMIHVWCFLTHEK